MTPERDYATMKTLAVAIAAATLAADQAGNLIDMLGFRAATLCPPRRRGRHHLHRHEQDRVRAAGRQLSDDSDLANVTDDDLVQGQPGADGDHGRHRPLADRGPRRGHVQKIGYIGGKRFLKLLADFSGTHGTGTPISATLIEEYANFEGAA
jgi:hypothetical protein